MEPHPGHNNFLVVVPLVTPEPSPSGKTSTVITECTMDNQISFDAHSDALAAIRNIRRR